MWTPTSVFAIVRLKTNPISVLTARTPYLHRPLTGFMV
jgi:hypothetical protein